MKVLLQTEKAIWHHGEPVIVIALALNDSYADVDFGHELLVGPTPVRVGASRSFPVSVEPPPAQRTLLRPFTIYGRERRYAGLPPGQYAFHAYLLKKATPQLLPTGPADPALLVGAAYPLHITVEP
jgi:hypothetical protein